MCLELTARNHTKLPSSVFAFLKESCGPSMSKVKVHLRSHPARPREFAKKPTVASSASAGRNELKKISKTAFSQNTGILNKCV